MKPSLPCNSKTAIGRAYTQYFLNETVLQYQLVCPIVLLLILFLFSSYWSTAFQSFRICVVECSDNSAPVIAFASIWPSFTLTELGTHKFGLLQSRF